MFRLRRSSCFFRLPIAVFFLVAIIAAGCSDDTTPVDASVDSGIDGPQRDSKTTPDSVQPDSVQPDSVQPDSVLPDSVLPDSVQPDSVQPDSVQPDSMQPDSMQPDSVLPDSVQPDSVQPDSVQPDSVQPDSVQPDSMQPDSMQPDSMLPDAALPDAALPDAMVDGPVADAAADLVVSPDMVTDAPIADAFAPDSAPTLYTISGAINQFGGPSQGTRIYVRLYTSNDPAQILNHVAEWSLNVISGQFVANETFSFQAASGTYYLRAFRDDGGRGGAPDGQPTMLADAQSAARMVVVAGADSTGNDLSLVARGNTIDSYDAFDARTINNIDARPPIGNVGGVRVAGQGRCNGYFLSLSAERQGTTSALSPPRVALPSGSVITLLNDGGCADTVLDNSSSSYDLADGDNVFSYGIASPTSTHAGNYTFFYHQSTDDFIHIEVDNIAAIVEMPRARMVNSPTGAAPNTNLNPQVAWQPVTGAGYYTVDIFSRNGAYDNTADANRILSGTVYNVSPALVDDLCYEITIRATDADPAGDIDAESLSPGDRFCTDIDGAQSITVSGSLQNNTSSTTPIQIFVNSGFDTGASVRLPANSTTYTVSVIAGAVADEGSVEAFVDAANTQTFSTPENRRNGISYTAIDLTSSQQIDFQLSPGPQLTSPAPWAVVASRRPALSWQDYSQVTGRPTGQWAYLVTIGDEINPNLARLVLPSTMTSLDLGNLPSRLQWFDLNALESCDVDGGTFTVAANGQPVCTNGGIVNSQTVLAATTLYDWSVSVIECDFTAYVPPATGDLLGCLRGVIATRGAVYANSELRGMMSPP
jgi:hypothetical protein